MAGTESSFTFHQAATLVVDTADELAREFFQAEYGPHAGTGPGLPAIHLRYRRQETLFSPPAGYTYHVHKLAARWAYRVTWHGDDLELDCLGNRFSLPMIHHMLVHPSLRLLCARRGMLLLHAGAVSCGSPDARSSRSSDGSNGSNGSDRSLSFGSSHSLLFTGQGGAGKTTTTALLMAYSSRGWAPHADDYTFLGPGPVSYAYLTRSHLYADLIGWIPSLKTCLSAGERIRLALLGRVRAWSGGRIKWPVRVALSRLWPGRAPRLQASPAGLIFLRRGSLDRPELAELSPGAGERDELLEMNFYEARHYLALMGKCGGLDQARLDRWRQEEMALIGRSLREIPVYRLTLPGKKTPAAGFGPRLADLLDARFVFSGGD